ncbi:MAG: AMP-binding protein [Parvibaculaceae bacterium]
MASAGQSRIAPVDGLSHVIGASEPPLLDLTIPELLRRTVERFPGREAAVFRAHGQRWSWKEFSDRVDQCAAALLALGLEKGDRVGIWSPNRPEWLLAQFATARVGIVLVNINPAYRRAELEYALNKVGCRVLITASRFKTSDYLQMLRDLAPELSSSSPGTLEAARLPHLETVIQLGSEPVAGTMTFDALMEKGAGADGEKLDAISKALDPDDDVNIQFTSGTTGAPKGATLSHRNIVNNGYFIGRAMELTEKDRLCIPVPFYHCFGMVLGNLACVSAGATMAFPGEGFDPLDTLMALHEERCTGVHGVPTMFVAMVDHPRFKEFDLSSLRTGIMAGAPCPIELMKRVVSEMHAREITIAYGMTETSPVSFQSGTKDPLERRVSTVGRIHPHVEVKVIDAEGGTVPVGERGELCTRGYSVMRGYWSDPERTAESIDADGWMHTGDLATIDKEGFCNIVGRVKDMVIRGGENIYPREIEEFLYRHPKVQSVQVFGVPDREKGEEVCAWVVLKPGAEANEEEVRTFCRGEIAHYKIPRYVRFVSELPMTVTGKPQKFLMREAMVKELGLTLEKTA